MDDKADYLLVGQDAQLGCVLYERLKQAGHNVLGTSRRQNAAERGALRLDLSADPSQWQLPKKVGVAFVVASMTKLDECHGNPDLSYKVNVTGIRALVERLVMRGAYVAVLSAGHVFDGQTAYRTPEDQPCPVDVYGRQKAAMESCLAPFLDRISIIRTAKMLPWHYSRFRQWQESWARGEAVTPFLDFCMAPVPYEAVASLLLLLSINRAKGIFHFSADQDVSYAEAAYIGCRTLGFDSQLVQPKMAAELGYQGPVFKHTCLDLDKTRLLLGVAPPKVGWFLERVFLASAKSKVILCC